MHSVDWGCVCEHALDVHVQCSHCITLPVTDSLHTYGHIIIMPRSLAQLPEANCIYTQRHDSHSLCNASCSKNSHKLSDGSCRPLHSRCEAGQLLVPHGWSLLSSHKCVKDMTCQSQQYTTLNALHDSLPHPITAQFVRHMSILSTTSCRTLAPNEASNKHVLNQAHTHPPGPGAEPCALCALWKKHIINQTQGV